MILMFSIVRIAGCWCPFTHIFPQFSPLELQPTYGEAGDVQGVLCCDIPLHNSPGLLWWSPIQICTRLSLLNTCDLTSPGLTAQWKPFIDLPPSCLVWHGAHRLLTVPCHQQSRPCQSFNGEWGSEALHTILTRNKHDFLPISPAIDFLVF